MGVQLTISMLVSDRMETLGRCLASIKPLLQELDSELIIVYTGKNPKTRELAEKYTSHIIPFTWCNDFSKARNAGLAEARGEWFLYLDDDEWFEDTGEIIQFFKSGEYQRYQSADYIQRNYLDWEGRAYVDAYVGRMCRLSKETRFVYPIHENLKPYPAPCRKFGAYVHHFGYVGKQNEGQKTKTERNLSLLLERLETEEASAQLYAQLAQEYEAAGEYEEGLRYCREGIVLAGKEKKGDSLEMWLQLELPHLFACMGDLKLALEEGEKILKSPRISEVGEINLAAKLVDFCWSLKKYDKGLQYVAQYRKGLQYLWKHPEIAVEQNGITATFSGAEKQAAELYVKGLFFALESKDNDMMQRVLSWLPWEDTIQIAAQYGNLEEWKNKYTAQKEMILDSYSNLDSDNLYVCLQKAYYEESRGKKAETQKYWAQCADGRLEGFLGQIVDMAVRNGFSLKNLLGKVSLEEWTECADALAVLVEIPDIEAFYSRISPELLEYPIFRERLRQRLLERQLTQGLLESESLLDLLSEYCKSVTEETGMLYLDRVLKGRDSYAAPVQYRFAVRVGEALRLIEAGNIADSISLLAEALQIYPRMSAALSHLTRYLNERIRTMGQPVSEEFRILGGQVKQVLYGLIENRQWAEALGVIRQLIALLPEDMEVLRLKQEIIRNL